ncbi:MAG: hypothetical protein FJ299_00640 [Planctomycetes bacterium]|nr:hypothetical protein [Planctomycetota bacterium]
MKPLLLRATLALCMLPVAWLAAEGIGSLSLAWKASRTPIVLREQFHCEYDPDLGWMNKPNWRAPNVYGPGIDLNTNSQRLRGTREHALGKPAGTYRVLCLGDSFTMGYGVADDESYPARLEQACPGLEAICMGLGGFGLDQAYLWYRRDGVKFEIDTLLVAVIDGDFYRMVALEKATESPKPQLELHEGRLVVTNVPVPNYFVRPETFSGGMSLWKASALYRWISGRSKPASAPAAPVAFRDMPFAPLARAVFEQLRDLSRERGQRLVVVYLPVRNEAVIGRTPLCDEWLAPMLRELGIDLVELIPDFKALTPGRLNTHYLADGHYSELGNTLAAAVLLRELRRLDPGVPR